MSGGEQRPGRQAGSPFDAPTRTFQPPSQSEDAFGTPSRVLSPGDVLGHYRLLRLLGPGGMGEVYETEDVRSGRRVAVKTSRTGLEDASDRARFLREGRLAASFSHPNVVYVFGTQEIDGIPVIVTELVPGGTLRDLVNRYGPLAPTDAVDTMLQVIAGLKAVAAGGVLHRDSQALELLRRP